MTTRLISEQQLNELKKHIEDQLHQEKMLEQNIRQHQDQIKSANAQLFLELLDILDGLQFSLNYLKKNPELSGKNVKRFARSLKGVQTKLLTILEQRDVISIDLDDSNYSECYQIVDQEIHEDLEDNTILKIIRPGFRTGEQILRPAEVITSKTS